MTQHSYKSEHGGVVISVLLVIMLIIIGVLVYILISGRGIKTHHGSDIQSPSQNTTTPGEIIATNEIGDGLINPDYTQKHELDDFGAGIADVAVFNRDINNDGHVDKIVRTRHENGTDHFYYEYKISVANNGTFIDITPDGFRTTEGAECALQKLKFSFKPDFRVVKVSRPWQESWTTPTMATKTVYTLNGDKITPISSQELKVICDVADLI